MHVKRRRVQISFDKELGMTRPEFAGECEINNIINKYQKTGVITHINNHSAEYADYDAMDFQKAMDTIKNGETMFAELPSKVRKFFDNDPAAFMEYVNDPENIDGLVELGLATARKTAEEPQNTSDAPQGSETTDPVP